MKFCVYILFIFTVCWTACSNDPTTEQSKTDEVAVVEVALPNTPEEIVRLYQKNLDENEFAAAKRMSTPKEKERLDMLAEIISGDLLDSTLVQTVFLKLDCSEDGNVATCIGVYQEDGEEYEDEFKLSKINGQWLVDVTEEEIFIETQEMVTDSVE